MAAGKPKWTLCSISFFFTFYHFNHDNQVTMSHLCASKNIDDILYDLQKSHKLGKCMKYITNSFVNKTKILKVIPYS